MHAVCMTREYTVVDVSAWLPTIREEQQKDCVCVTFFILVCITSCLLLAACIQKTAQARPCIL